MAGVPHHLVEIDDCIEMSRRTNPCVDGLSIQLIPCRGMVIVGAGVRHYRRPDDLKSMCMRPQDDLLVRTKNLRNQRIMLGDWHFANCLLYTSDAADDLLC